MTKNTAEHTGKHGLAFDLMRYADDGSLRVAVAAVPGIPAGEDDARHAVFERAVTQGAQPRASARKPEP